MPNPDLKVKVIMASDGRKCKYEPDCQVKGGVEDSNAEILFF